MSYKDDSFNIDFNDFSDVVIESKRKAPICLVLDNSGSMAERYEGTMKIDELNNNMKRFLEFVRNNEKARRISDLSIISFGGKVDVVSGYTSIDKIKFKPLVPTGSTPLGAAMEKAIELLDLRRNYYRENGIERYKPTILVMSDGQPTDNYLYIADKVSSMVKNKEIKIFPVGIGADFRKDALKAFSPFLEPKLIHNSAGFSKLFELLSASTSNPEDDQLEKWFDDEF